MGIRELAAAAKTAEEAAAKAEKKRLWALNAKRGEQAVLDHLGVVGKAHKAHSHMEMGYGDGTVVLLEDDIYVKVEVSNVYEKNPYSYGTARVIDHKVTFVLVDDNGYRRGYSPTSFTTLAGLGDQLTAAEKYEARRAADEAARAARKVDA